MANYRYSELEDFIGGYFNQDWGVDGESAEQVLETAIAEFPITPGRDVVRSVFEPVISEIDRWLAAGPDDDTTGRFLDKEIGSYFLPTEHGYGNNEWLQMVRRRLEEAIERAPVDPDRQA